MLSGLQVTEEEAAAELGISLKTFREILRIDASAREAWEQGRLSGRVSIRRTQFKLAEKNPSMAIFLGKQYLGQSDVQVHQHSGPNGGPIQSQLDLTKLSAGQRRNLREILTTARPPKTKTGTRPATSEPSVESSDKVESQPEPSDKVVEGPEILPESQSSPFDSGD